MIMFLVTLVILVGLGCSWRHFDKIFLKGTRHNKPLTATAGGYERWLESAKANRNNATVRNNHASMLKNEIEMKGVFKDVVKGSNKNNLSSPSCQPSVNVNLHATKTFDDDLYDHFKFIISKLTAKIKFDTSLTPAELVRFEVAVKVILAEAGVPISDERLAEFKQNKSSKTIDKIPETVGTPSDPFAALHGKKSTWDIDGMEDMNTTQFYEALNKRNADIRALLKANQDMPGGGTHEYLESLNNGLRSEE